METKKMNITFDMDTGYWTARDNGEVIGEGQGIVSAALFEKEWKEKHDKPVRFKYKNKWW